MLLVIDYRERDLIDNINQLIPTEHFKDYFGKEIHISVENLEIGDIIIRDKEKDVIIIERKTVCDLVSSVKDGRYNEQSLRLTNSEVTNHNIMYLIEGNIPNTKTFKDKRLVFSSMFSLNFNKGFSVIRTNNIQETAYMLCNMIVKIQKDGIKENTETKTYSSMIKKKKQENITTANFGEIVLAQIPGVSGIYATAIIAQFQTLNNLIENLKKNPDILKDIKYTMENGQERKISKTVITNIVNFLINC
jgi:ERCC4-type nuclease